MDNQKTLFFIGAHPDDESFGMGGTLAQYVTAGVKVYYICATRGEAGTVSPEFLKRYASMADLRTAELECAARTLGLTDVIYLGYRDSGMTGAPDNKHPQALINAPLEEVTGRMVAVIRRLKPEVVITFDPIGGYRHPDHIVTHNAAVKAFHAAGDPAQYPEAGIAFQSQKLYYGVMRQTAMKLAIRLWTVLGKDVHHFGRNKDIDLAATLDVEFPVHAVIRLKKKAVETRSRAAACHASQLGGRPRRGGVMVLANLLTRWQGARDYFMRAYPVPVGSKKEKDLFQDVR